MVVFSMLEKQYKFRSIISNKKVPKKFGNLIFIVTSLKNKGLQQCVFFSCFYDIHFYYLPYYQHINNNSCFQCLLY